MLQNYDFIIIGGDLRLLYICINLLKKGYTVATYGVDTNKLEDLLFADRSLSSYSGFYTASSIDEALNISKNVICPIPLSRDYINIFSNVENKDLTLTSFQKSLTKEHIIFAGSIPTSLGDYFTTNGFIFHDFMEEDEIAMKNAVATAEGTLMEAFIHSVSNIHKSKCLVLGFGRCAWILAKKLSGLDAIVTIGARSKEAITKADCFGYDTLYLKELSDHIHEFDYIFNTIPSLVLNKNLLKLVSNNCTIIDIASAPGGLDYNYVKEINLNAHLCLGLPGKIAPKASADILTDYIISVLEERR